VLTNNPFYEFIRCLACRGIISGYADGSFKPNNPVTRGQAAKIITGAAGLNDNIPNNRQSFADVPNSNAFWVFIERARVRNLISGYNCGGPGEPCDGQSRPYFRWGNNLTRGQLSKIVSEAAGFNEAVSGQRFIDVPPSNPFYAFIERLAARNIISGYTVPGGMEFRWGNPVTRGQTAKIVGGAFFPNCQTPLK
jgi:hypothetical protein